MLLFANNTMLNNINNIQLENVKFSVMKNIAKKGAAIIKLDIYDTSVAFINCHLSSEIDKSHLRISDLKHIFKAIDSSSHV